MIPPFFRVRSLDVTTSTNDDVKKAVLLGEEEGLVVMARRQTAGRGRQGRVWESLDGNLFASVLLRPYCTVREAGLYSFVAALAVLAAVQKALPEARAKLKWPNDVLVDGKKISGVLLETSCDPNGFLDWLVMGVGINVAVSPQNLAYPTTSLAAEGADTEAEAVLESFLTSVDQWRLTLRHDGFWPLRRAWLAAAQGGEMTVRLPQGQVTGTFGGIDETGRLILRLADGSEQAIATGDVFYP